MAITKHTKLPADTVTTVKIADNTIVNADVSSCAAIAQSKISSLSTSLSNVCSAITSATNLNNTNNFNVGLLGFKMAVNESLTVFNLVDGIVDEFQDESGVDNSASTSLTYNSTDDYYINSTQPDGLTLNYSAGFTTTTVTEPDTSTAGTNPAVDTGSTGTFTVPTNITSLSVAVWGSGGGAGSVPLCGYASVEGGAGGYVSGTLSVTPSQTLYVTGGQGGPSGTQSAGGFLGGGSGEPGTYGTGGTGGGAAGIFSASVTSPSSVTSPQVFIIAGAGGGSGNKHNGGPGGGLQGFRGSGPFNSSPGLTTSNTGPGGFGAGGGSQSAGGQGSPFTDSGSAGPTSNPGPGTSGSSGSFLEGGNAGVTPQGSGGGGSGFYGGGGGGGCTYNSVGGAGGGGSSYYGNPSITSGSTLQTQAAPMCQPNTPNVKVGAGIAQPGYVSCTNNGGEIPGSGQPGFVLMTASLPATATSSTIISDPFTSTTVPTTTRIVVFEENVGTPSLNTDIVASVSRNGGTNFTNVTLSDSGYVTGSSGQRILTGQASISGQPSGQSMKWKLELANNTVKIHGVSLSWA